MRPLKHSGRRRFRSARQSVSMGSLEARCLLAAHVVGDATVYQTIQAAIDAAAPGGIVNVDAGTYAELVRISKSLTVRGAEAGVDARSNLRAGAGESILTGVDLGGTRSSSFYITADDVTIDGFVVQGNTSTATYGAGIVIAPNTSGAHILNNIVQNNVAGLYLANASSTDQAVIQHNIFALNNNAGPNGGRGIYTDETVAGNVLTNVSIDGNYFYRNYGGAGTTGVEAAISFESRGAVRQSNITITNNVMDFNGKAVLMWNAQNVSISGNVITNSRDQYSAALRFEGGASSVSIAGNTAYDNTGPAVRIDNKGYAADSSGFTITGNNFYRNGRAYTNKPSLILGVGDYTGPLDATNNWWGSATGPSGDGSGSGDAIVRSGASATFAPWATAIVGDVRVGYFGRPAGVGAPIQAEAYNHGGEGFGYHDLDTTNTGTQYRTLEGADVETAGDTGGGYDVGWFQPGEWLEYAINVPAAGAYRLDLRLANGQTAGGTMHAAIDGVDVTGPVTSPTTGGWQKWQTFAAATFNLTAGTHLLRLAMDVGGSAGYGPNINWLNLVNTALSPAPAAPSGLIAAAPNPTTVHLAWADNSNNETGFVIERSKGSGGIWTALATVGANVTSYVDSPVLANTAYTYRLRATGASADSGTSNEAAVLTPSLPTATYVSDLPFVGVPTNGWGPVERDLTNGGQGAADGPAITLNGVTYAKGLGCHAYSEVTIDLAGNYATFLSDIGVDDQEGSNGSVVFQVWADGVKLFESGVMTGDSPTASVRADVTGMQQLKLIVTDSGDGIDYDHADWAGARLLAPTVVSGPVAPSGLATKATSPAQVDLAWTDNASDESGFLIERSTDGVTFNQIGTTGPDTGSYSDTTAAPATAYAYRVRAWNGNGNSAYSNTAVVTTPVVPPLAPTGLTATPASINVNLAWTDNSINETGFRIERSLDGVNFTEIATVGVSVTTYSDSAAPTGVTLTYRVRAYNGGGVSDYSNLATTILPVASLPGPFVQGDIGAVGQAGSGTFAAGTFTVSGSGSDIASTADSFHFVYQAITGNCTIIAKVVSVQNTNAQAKAGIMIRESLAANARNAAIVVTPSSGITYQRRTSAGQTTATVTTASLKAPYWVKLVRSGSTFSAYRSADGVTWTLIGSNGITMASSVYVGLVVCSRANTVLNTSTFSNVSVTAG